MKKKIYLFIVIAILFSCVSQKNDAQVNSSIGTTGNNESGTIIKIDNPTDFNVYFSNGQRVAKKSNGTNIILNIEEGALSRGFDILYEIPLSDTVPIYCKGDYRTFREKQSVFTVISPQITENYGPYIIIKNNVNNAVTFYTGGNANPTWEQKGNPKDGNYLNSTNKREFSPGETSVYDISGDIDYNNYYIRDNRKSIHLVLPEKVKKNYIYSFEYAAQGVELIDFRPLHRIGESSWVKTIEDADCLEALVKENREINLFASIIKDNKSYKKGLNRIVYDSSGDDKITKIIQSGDNLNITYASVVKDGLFVVGFKEESRNKYRSQARVISENGETLRLLAESGDYESARIFTVSQKDNTWLLAGDGVKYGFVGNTAYARLIRDDENKFAVINECGGNYFPEYKNIKAVEYNNKLNYWLISGEMKEPSSGFYLSLFNNSGEIQKISEFPNMEFYKIIVDSNNNYYLIGQEQKTNETYGIVIKYDSNNKKLWQSSNQPPSNSYYYTSVLDNENNQIILAGTLQAKDEYGTGGKPFIEAVNTVNGSRIWQEILSDSEFKDTSLVTSIAIAPEYGLILSLSGVKDGIINKPYKFARLNSQGKQKK